MRGPAVDGLVDVDVSIPDLYVEATVKICANPGLVENI